MKSSNLLYQRIGRIGRAPHVVAHQCRWELYRICSTLNLEKLNIMSRRLNFQVFHILGRHVEFRESEYNGQTCLVCYPRILDFQDEISAIACEV